MSDFSYGVITVSDSCHQGTKIDESGPNIKLLLQREFNAIKISQMTVPDDKLMIEKMLKYYSDDLKLNCVFTTGGTGFAPRDVTPEATANVIERTCHQLAFTMFIESSKKTPFAALSRAICGIRGSTLIINFPGSKKAVVECFESIQKIIPHAIELIIDQKSNTDQVHFEMQQDFKLTSPNPESHSEVDSFFDSVSVTSSTSGAQSMTGSVASLFRRVDEINEKRNEIEKTLKPQKLPKVDIPEQTFERSIQRPFASDKPEKKSRTEEDDISEILSKSSTMEEMIIDVDILKSSSVKKELKPETPSSTSRSEPKLPKNLSTSFESPPTQKHHHVCPHKTANSNDKDDRNSPYPMIEVDAALQQIFSKLNVLTSKEAVKSPMNIPPFRASIKDGYAVKSSSKHKLRKVIGNVSAGDKIVKSDFSDHECYKINTGAAVPHFADAVIQVEDTKLLASNPDGTEREIEILTFPKKNLDIRNVGCDLVEGETMFTTSGLIDVAEKSILASVGLSKSQRKPKIGIISTGDELVDPTQGELCEGQIYDSNTTMLKLLVEKHGFEVEYSAIAKDHYDSLKGVVQQAMKKCDVIISSGGVSMGDKDLVKPLMKELGFEILFGRVNMKPGKPMTFASNGKNSYFALPGNPVSAFVTFHLFLLPSLRFMCGYSPAKCVLPEINVILQIDKYVLDSRPEYARGRVAYDQKKGIYLAYMPENQMSSRLATLINADVLLHLPGSTKSRATLCKGSKLRASVINFNFISEYVS